MAYCEVCGTKLMEKECGVDGLIPYCEHCGDYRFPTFSTAIITAVLNPTHDKVLLLKQYGKDRYILLAGYVMKGENAEETLVREVKEEVGLDVTDQTYMASSYFEGHNTLMLNYYCTADSEDLSDISPDEVDGAKWFTLHEAQEKIAQGSLAHRFLNGIVAKLESETGK